MSENIQCAALTKGGTQCKNAPQEDSIYCYVHRNYEAELAETEPGAPGKTGEPLAISIEEEDIAPADETIAVDEQPAASGRASEAFEKLVSELNQAADQLRQRFPGFNPPDYSPRSLVVALRDNADRIAPGLHLKESKLLTDLEEELEGKSSQDFLDLETWKGLWYVFNVALQTQADNLRTATSERLERLPDTMTELRHELEISGPTDLFAVQTWKNVLRFSRDTLQHQVDKLRSNDQA